MKDDSGLPKNPGAGVPHPHLQWSMAPGSVSWSKCAGRPHHVPACWDALMIMDAGLLTSPFVMAHNADCSGSESAPFQGERGMLGTHDPPSLPSAPLLHGSVRLYLMIQMNTWSATWLYTQRRRRGRRRSAPDPRGFEQFPGWAGLYLGSTNFMGEPRAQQVRLSLGICRKLLLIFEWIFWGV